jgi:hypothetical protein
MPTERDSWQADFRAALQRLRPGMYYPGRHLDSLANSAWAHRGQESGADAARAWCEAHPLPGEAPNKR